MTKKDPTKRAYFTPQVVDFGPIEEMTGDCFGYCLDGENGGLFGFWP